ISDLQGKSQPTQQTLQPQRVAHALQPHQNFFPGQRLIEPDRLLWMQQLTFHQLACFRVQHGNLLKARMKITAYNLHDWLLSTPSSLVFKATIVYRVEGAGVVIKSERSACRNSFQSILLGAESKDPENGVTSCATSGNSREAASRE